MHSRESKIGLLPMLRGMIMFLLSCVCALSGVAASDIILRGPATVIDGDTMDIGPLRLRLHGIDAPERGQTCQRSNGDVWRCGAKAGTFLAEQIDGEIVDCSPLDRDPYGRIIAICYVNTRDIAAELIGAGLAWAYTEYSNDYVQLEDDVRTRRIGIWQGFAQVPWEYREDKWERAVAAAPDGCPIKGNISARSGERIYHTPWSPNFAGTKIDESAGERWFCDEAEALAAGWRAVASR